MIRPRVFLPLLLVTASVTASLTAATVSGTVSFEARRGQKPNPAEAVVWAEPLDARARIAPREAVMTTRAKTLIPHVLAVPAGSTVRFPNEDPITHNLFSVSPANPFDLGLYRRGDEGNQQRFDEPGIVNVYCNVHPNMSAVVVVLDTPHWTQPEADGAWKLQLPPGRYQLHAWHEQGGTSESLVVIGRDGTIQGTTNVRFDVSRYRSTPHLNKHGKPYSRVRDY
ncbi:MAG: cupredoxin domain-containing protein [Thermoanaerobaculia bacterium]